MRAKTYTGTVTKQTVAKGSKSEHQGVVLQADDGTFLRLRIDGNNPFRDPALDAFVGKRVSVKGTLHKNVSLLMIANVADIAVLPPAGPQPKDRGCWKPRSPKQ